MPARDIHGPARTIDRRAEGCKTPAAGRSASGTTERHLGAARVEHSPGTPQGPVAREATAGNVVPRGAQQALIDQLPAVDYRLRPAAERIAGVVAHAGSGLAAAGGALGLAALFPIRSLGAPVTLKAPRRGRDCAGDQSAPYGACVGASGFS